MLPCNLVRWMDPQLEPPAPSRLRRVHRMRAALLNPSFPAVFLRLVQVAIWRFCAERGFDFCNGNRIDDRAPCQRQACPFWDECHHVPLKPAA